jgi:UDP:flavonoid glycosyltransferase YjiC (YdhE family)
VLELYSKVLAQPQPDWPQNTHLCRYFYYDKRGELPASSHPPAGGVREGVEELNSWLDSGDAPIVFTLGSSAVFDARDFYEQSTLAARALGRRALLLIGDEPNRPQSLPQNDDQIAAFHYAPYGEVFSRATAIVHQGGAGTTGQVLRSGAPSLVMPYSHDQPDHAARIERLGVARTITRRKYSAARATRELETILNDRTYKLRAQEIAAQVREENGPATAADAIERLM